MNDWLIDRVIPKTRPNHICWPQTFTACFEIRRDVYGDAPRSFTDQCHERLRWTRFALVWAAVGGQIAMDQAS